MYSLIKYCYSLYMRRINVLFIVLLMMGIPSVSYGQRSKKAVELNPIEEAHKEIGLKKFPEAIEILQKSITEQKKLRRPKWDVQKMESLIDSIEIEMMRIRNTQKVVFVDSVVVGKDKLLRAFRLNREVGRIISAKHIAAVLKQNFSHDGKIAFVNELFDHVYFSQNRDGKMVLCNSVRFGNAWDEAKPLLLKDNNDDEQDYPFILTDGITLYYSAKGKDSYGGWDIFVTRYDHDSGKFLKAQNLGMPFNTEANDYLYVIDETINTGYFATDRHHGPDSICVYTFIPPSMHSSFSNDTPFDVVKNAAYISSIQDSQNGMQDIIESWKRKKEEVAMIIFKGEDLYFVINDEIVYTGLSEFKSKVACEIAEKLLNLYEKKTTVLELLDILREQYVEQPSDVLRDNILQSELELSGFIKEIRELEKNMRIEELKTIENQ